MDTFELKWSLQKLVKSKAYRDAGEIPQMWNDQHITWRLVKEKNADQSIEDFLLEFESLKKNAYEDIRLRIQFVINGKYLEKTIKYSYPNHPYDLFLEGYPQVFEFVELKQAYEWGVFLMKKLRGEEIITNEETNIYEEKPSDPTQLYCCGFCGWDRICGTWQVNIARKNDLIVWNWGAYQWNIPPFYFEASQYLNALHEYGVYLEKKLQLSRTHL